MNKQDLIDKINNIGYLFKNEYLKNNFLKYMEKLEINKDYVIQSNSINNEEITNLLNLVLDKNNKNLNEFNIKDLMSSREEYYSHHRTNFPYIEIKKTENKIVINSIKIDIIGDQFKGVNIDINIIFKDKGVHIENILNKEKEYNEIRNFSYYDFENDLRDLLKDFPKAEDFIYFIKDKKEFENIYKYLNK